MCETNGWATGWDVIVSVRRSHHRLEVFMDQSLEPLGISFAQYRAFEAILLYREIHISELARLLRLSRQAVHMAVQKLHAGDLVDLIQEPGRVYVKPSAAGLRRLHLLRKFTDDVKGGIEAALSGDERHRLTSLLERVDGALEPPRQPEWWLAP